MRRGKQGVAREGSPTSSSTPTRSISSRIACRRSRRERRERRRRTRMKRTSVREGDGRSTTAVLLRLLPSQFRQSSRVPLYSTVDNSAQPQGEEPTPEEKALLREEFITQMHQRFLDGKDKDFNYRSATPPLNAFILCKGWICATDNTTNINIS